MDRLNRILKVWFRTTDGLIMNPVYYNLADYKNLHKIELQNQVYLHKIEFLVIDSFKTISHD